MLERIRQVGRRGFGIVIFLGLVLVLLSVRSASAANFVQQAKLTPSDAALGDGFGREVALSASASLAAVAATEADCSAGPNCGAVYLFLRTKNTWHQQVKLTALDATSGSELGRGIALSADSSTLLARARSNDCPDSPDCAVVYVFRRLQGGWRQTASLKIPGSFWGLDYGIVALSGDGRTAMVGSPGYCTPHLCTGIVHVFVRQGEKWSAEAQLSESAANHFGNSISLSRDGLMAMIGAGESEAAATETGIGGVFSYIKKHGVWIRNQELALPRPNPSEDQFGQVSLSGDGSTVLVSSPPAGCVHEIENPDENSYCGAVRIFSRAGGVWTDRQMLTAPGQHGGQFGDRTAISGNGGLALILSPDSLFFSRSANTWSQQQQLVPGSSVSLSADGRTALVGVHHENCDGGVPCSAAYVFTVTPARAAQD